MALIVVSRQFGGDSSSGLMALVYSRSKCFLTLLAKCLIISALTPLVSGALPLLVDGVVEFLHRERRHCVLWLVVFVLVFVCRLRGGVEPLVELLREHIRNALSVVLVGVVFVLHLRYENFLASGFDGGLFWGTRSCSRCLRCFVFFRRS